MRGRIALALALGSIAHRLGATGTRSQRKFRQPGPMPVLRVPAWTKGALPNGADLIVSEKHDLPLVSFSITFLGGENQFEPAGRQGVASLTAALLSEGTKTRNGEALSNALQLLGTTVNANVAGETGSVGFVSTTAKFGADARHPRRHAAELDVSRGRPRAASRAAARRADAGARAAGCDRQPGLSAHRLRLESSVWPHRDGGIAEGHHPRRHRRLSQGVLPARTRADHGRRATRRSPRRSR